MVHIPPLRDDIELLGKLIDEFRYILRAKKLSKEAKEVLLKYSWPGNIRELKQVMTRAGINVEKDVIGEREIIQCMKNHLNEKELEMLISNLQMNEKCKDIKVEKFCSNNRFDFQLKEINRIRTIIESIEKGKSFWEIVKKPYLQRDLNREEVKKIINFGLNLSKNKYKNLIRFFNLEEKDNHRFMRFLHEQRLIP